MEVILLERIEKLGQMGDVVTVKNGYARNFLLPQNKALRSTPENLIKFEAEKTQLEARNLERKKEAESVGEKLHGESFVIIRQASEAGQLYGSVTTRDIATAVSEGGISIERSQVHLDRPIKMIGLHELRVRLHAEVNVMVTINVARSDEEATRQAAGEDLTSGIDEDDVAEAEFQPDDAAVDADDVFETAELASEAADDNIANPSS